MAARGRGVTALDPKAQDFELMAEQVGRALEMACVVGAVPFCWFLTLCGKGTGQAVHLLCPRFWGAVSKVHGMLFEMLSYM